MFVTLLQKNILKNQEKLYSNNLRLVSQSMTTTVSNGMPVTNIAETTHWEGLGSIQYVRPRIQKSIASENAGMMEDPVSVVCYLPYEASPTEAMVIVDVDGIIGEAGTNYTQSRAPANVGGANVYWELYIGGPVNV